MSNSLLGLRKIKSICNLKIFIPHAVDPAHPPINIKNEKKLRKFSPKTKIISDATVPDKIEITLNEEI